MGILLRAMRRMIQCLVVVLVSAFGREVKTLDNPSTADEYNLALSRVSSAAQKVYDKQNDVKSAQAALDAAKADLNEGSSSPNSDGVIQTKAVRTTAEIEAVRAHMDYIDAQQAATEASAHEIDSMDRVIRAKQAAALAAKKVMDSTQAALTERRAGKLRTVTQQNDPV